MLLTCSVASNPCRYWATKGHEVAMTTDECILSSAASMAVGFTEDTTPEVGAPVR